MYHVVENRYDGEFTVKTCKNPAKDALTHFVKKTDAEKYAQKLETKFKEDQTKKRTELDAIEQTLPALVQSAPAALHTDQLWHYLRPLENWAGARLILKGITDAEKQTIENTANTLRSIITAKWRTYLEQTYNTATLTQGQRDILFEESQRTWRTDKQEKLYKKEAEKFIKLMNA